MNKKMKLGITAMTIGAMALSSVGAFAATASVAPASGSGFMRGPHQYVLDLMIKDGVVTQAQVDKYQDQIHAEREAEVKAAVSALVTKGTLTQAKADAVLAALETQQDAMQAYRDKLAGMTTEEARTYMQTNPMPKNNSLLTLVESGKLTAAEYDAVRSVVGKGGHMGAGGRMQMDGKMGNGMGGRFR